MKLAPTETAAFSNLFRSLKRSEFSTDRPVQVTLHPQESRAERGEALRQSPNLFDCEDETADKLAEPAHILHCAAQKTHLRTEKEAPPPITVTHSPRLRFYFKT